MNCLYCGSRLFPTDRCCERCGGPINMEEQMERAQKSRLQVVLQMPGYATHTLYADGGIVGVVTTGGSGGYGSAHVLTKELLEDAAMTVNEVRYEMPKMW